jgi:hypothetical protein
MENNSKELKILINQAKANLNAKVVQLPPQQDAKSSASIKIK